MLLTQLGCIVAEGTSLHDQGWLGGARSADPPAGPASGSLTVIHLATLILGGLEAVHAAQWKHD